MRYLIMMTLQLLPPLALGLVMLCGFVFACVFLRRKPPSPPDTKRERSSIMDWRCGRVLRFDLGRAARADTAITTGNSTRNVLAMAASVLAIGVAIGSVWLATTAVKTLGKEWSLTARLVEGHKLATSGPYAYVRHPIYSGMLGMLVATGLAISHWAALLAGLVVFFVGTIIRVRSEEKLLREAFGDEFENYAQRVPAIVPGVY